MAPEQLSAAPERLSAAPERLLAALERLLCIVTLFQKRNRYFRYNVIVSLRFTSLDDVIVSELLFKTWEGEGGIRDGDKRRNGRL